VSAISKVTSKYQATIPKEIREVLRLAKGDHVRFDVDGDVVTLYRATPLDLAYLRGLEDTLSEWLSDADEEAYRDL
jgi:antitoxin PrlF